MRFLKDHPDIKVVFTVAATRNSSIQIDIEKEQEQHCDIIQFNFLDNFYNNSLKIASTLHYLYLAKWDEHFGPPQLFYLTQDDIYINIPKFVKVRDQISKGINWKVGNNSIQQECEPHLPSVHGAFNQLPNDHTRLIQGDANDKYLLPPYIFSGKRAPPFMPGSGSFYPRGVIPAMMITTWFYPIVPLDDVWCGLILNGCGIKIKIIANHLNGLQMKPEGVIFHLGDIGGNHDVAEKRRRLHDEFFKHYKVID